MRKVSPRVGRSLRITLDGKDARSYCASAGARVLQAASKPASAGGRRRPPTPSDVSAPSAKLVGSWATCNAAEDCRPTRAARGTLEGAAAARGSATASAKRAATAAVPGEGSEQVEGSRRRGLGAARHGAVCLSCTLTPWSFAACGFLTQIRTSSSLYSDLAA